MQATRIADTNEINRRCSQVFDMQEGDFVWGIFLTDDGQLLVEMEEITEDGDSSGIFNFEPNMEERPEALAYLMGERDDFND
jgi:hypothetical protein